MQAHHSAHSLQITLLKRKKCTMTARGSMQSQVSSQIIRLHADFSY